MVRATKLILIVGTIIGDIFASAGLFGMLATSNVNTLTKVLIVLYFSVGLIFTFVSIIRFGGFRA